MVAVNTDAHSRLELANVVLGLSVARRGWLSAEDVLNTRETKELLRLLHEKRKKSPVG
jgi:DNA polymerase (family 10)